LQSSPAPPDLNFPLLFFLISRKETKPQHREIIFAEEAQNFEPRPGIFPGKRPELRRGTYLCAHTGDFLLPHKKTTPAESGLSFSLRRFRNAETSLLLSKKNVQQPPNKPVLK
jgi:hypothetical protein